MDRLRLGKTDIEVTRLCFGSLTVGPLQAALSIDAGSAVISYALGRGINFIDTAQYYKNYEYIQQALKKTGLYDTVVSTKTYAYDRAGAETAFEEARRALDRDYIDIFMLHEQESVHTFRGHAEALEYLFELKARSLIRAVGASTHHIAAVEGALEIRGMYPLDVLHPIFNKSGIGVADGTAEGMLAALKKAKAAGIGIFSMKPLGGGHLHLEAGEAFDYVLDAEAVDGSPLADSVAVGMQSEEEVDANIRYFETRVFSPSDCERLAKKKRRLHIEDYCEGCGKCAARCTQKAMTVIGGRAVCDDSRCVMCGYCSRVCPVFAIKVL